MVRKPKTAQPKGDAAAKAKRGGSRQGSGRKSDYKPEYARMAKALHLQGQTEAEIAKHIGKSRKTLTRWRLAHEEFEAAFHATDAEYTAAIKHSLARQALGGHFGSQKFWLVNRDPDNWADKKELTGRDGAPLVPILNVQYGTADHRPSPA